MSERLEIRIHGESSGRMLVYLPGLHGDWTLLASFRKALGNRARLVEITYPRTLDWSLDDHAREIRKLLERQGIHRGWLLAESFGSQIAWTLARECISAPVSPVAFRLQGIILAGGFARHPIIPGVHLMKYLVEHTPTSLVRVFLFCYRRYARFRHRKAPETLAGIDEFIARRTELDRQAMIHRLRLIAASDPREFIKSVQLPVFDLTGAVDPIVHWPFVRLWLRKNCPGHLGSATIWTADHNVLATAPEHSARVVSDWIDKHSLT